MQAAVSAKVNKLMRNCRFGWLEYIGLIWNDCTFLHVGQSNLSVRSRIPIGFDCSDDGWGLLKV